MDDKQRDWRRTALNTVVWCFYQVKHWCWNYPAINTHQRARTGWTRHTTRSRRALVRCVDDRPDPSTANAQPARTRVRLRPRLLVQTHSARPGREVVVSRPLLRSSARESRPRRMEANQWPRGARGVETATARGVNPSAKASDRACGRGASLPGAGGRASSAERPDRRRVVSPGDARVRLPRAR
jgi:hypothetical protein